MIQHRIDMLETEINSGQELKAIIDELHKIRHNVIHMNIVLPFTFKGKVVDRINTMLRSIKEITLIQNRCDMIFIFYHIEDTAKRKPIPLN